MYTMSCWFNFAGSPFLTPEAVYCCPGERVTITCVVNTGNKLYWDVDYSDPSLPGIHRQRYLATEDQPGLRKHGNIFEFNLTSNSPSLISTTSTTIQHPELVPRKVDPIQMLDVVADAIQSDEENVIARTFRKVGRAWESYGTSALLAAGTTVIVAKLINSYP